MFVRVIPFSSSQIREGVTSNPFSCLMEYQFLHNTADVFPPDVNFCP